jgi:hypothetical protein
MMILGFCSVGAVTYRRRKVAPLAASSTRNHEYRDRLWGDLFVCDSDRQVEFSFRFHKPKLCQWKIQASGGDAGYDLVFLDAGAAVLLSDRLNCATLHRALWTRKWRL